MNFYKFNKTTFLILSWLVLFSLNVSAQTDSNSARKVEFDKKTLQDFAEVVIDKSEKEKLDLTTSFSIEFEGFLNESGKLDSDKTKFIKTDGDEKLVDLTKSGIEAISNSGFLRSLVYLGIQNLKVKVSQNKDTFSIIAVSNLESTEKAKTSASAFRAMFSILNIQIRNPDEKFLIKNVSSQSNDSQLILSFNASKADVHELINRKIQEASKKRNNLKN